MVNKKVKNAVRKKLNKEFPLWAVEDPESFGMTEADLKRAWQKLVDTGQVWRLQGWYGITASSLIEQGIIHPPKRKTSKNITDYYGNKIRW